MARALEAAVVTTLRDVRTPDIGGRATTAEFTAAVHRNFSWLRWEHSPEDPGPGSFEWAV
jgi:hypothetical protein